MVRIYLTKVWILGHVDSCHAYHFDHKRRYYFILRGAGICERKAFVGVKCS